MFLSVNLRLQMLTERLLLAIVSLMVFQMFIILKGQNKLGGHISK